MSIKTPADFGIGEGYSWGGPVQPRSSVLDCETSEIGTSAQYLMAQKAHTIDAGAACRVR